MNIHDYDDYPLDRDVTDPEIEQDEGIYK